MIDQEASERCRMALQGAYAALTPGVACYVLRDGEPFVDASFGHARVAGAADGQLAYGADTIVHLASVSKFICAVAVLRLIEEWNDVFAHLRRNRLGERRYIGPSRPDDAGLIASVQKHGVALSLDTRVYDFMKARLDHASIAKEAAGYPGNGITDITLRQLLTHRSGLRDKLMPERLGLTADQIVRENEPGGKAFFDLSRDISVLFARNVVDRQESYSNEGYNALGAFVQFVTATPFEAWCRKKILPHRSFGDIARRPADMSRAARYYRPGRSGTFAYGNHHPDYADFGACGGWYASASALCRWIHAVMKQQKFGGPAIKATIRRKPGDDLSDTAPQVLQLGDPILRDPRPLFTLGLGVDSSFIDFGYLRGRAKNGGTDSPGGATNCRFAYFEGYGGYSFVAFAHANCSVNANPLLDAALAPLRRWLYDPSPLVGRPIGRPMWFDAPGLRRTACWDDGGVQQRAEQGVEFVVDTTNWRTDLFGTTPYAPGRGVNDRAFLKLEGYLRALEAGQYRFRLTSDDGAMLWLADALVVDNDGHALTSSEGRATLAAGSMTPLLLQWYNAAGSGGLFLEWRRPGALSFEPVPPEQFRQGTLKLPPIEDNPRPMPL